MNCPFCHAVEARLEVVPQAPTWWRCLDCTKRFIPGDQPRHQDQFYDIDIEGLCYPSIFWVYSGTRPPDPLRVVEVLVDFMQRGKERRAACIRCMGWIPAKTLERPRLPMGASPGSSGSCAGCALSYLDAVDAQGHQVRDLPENYLAQEAPSYYRDLRTHRSERTRVEYWATKRKGMTIRTSELTGEDVEVVDRVRLLRRAGRTPGEVAITLNAEGYRTSTGEQWTKEMVIEIGRGVGPGAREVREKAFDEIRACTVKTL